MIISAAICALGWGAVSAYAAEGDESGTALFMPSSYEQYLGVEAPSDFAISERYVAVAKDSSIYLYDRNDANGYQVYTHTSNVSSLNFYTYEGSTYLYFTSDEGGNNPIVYKDCDAENFTEPDTAQPTAINSCSAFAINGTEICFANASNSVYRTQMNGLDIVNVSEAVDMTSSKASFSVYNGSIYFAKDRTIYTADGRPTIWSTRHDIASFALVEGVCYYTSNENYFYRATNSGTDDELLENDGVSSFRGIRLCDDGNIYLLQNDSIRRYDTADGFTGYEIGRYSGSANRIGRNASDLSVCGSRIAVADTGNERVLLAEKSANGSYTYKEITTEGFSPSLICAQENTFAVASNRSLRIYPYDGGSYTEIEQTFGAAIGGIAYSYGKYYVAVSGMSILYEIDEASGRATERDLDTAITSVTADIHGNLYILSGTSVQKYGSDFTALATYTAPSGTKKILCDYEGNLYALDQSGSIFSLREDGSQRVFTPPEDLNGLVHYGSSTPSAVSFAFGFESKDVYVLSDGFIAVTQKLGVKSLNDLDADGVYAALFDTPLSADDYNGLLVNVAPDSVVIALDVTELAQDSAALPYHGYQKTAEVMTGVVLAETGDGTLVGVFTKTPSGEVDVLYSYNVWLVLKDGGEDSVTAVEGARYLSSPDYSDGYVVEAVGLYRFPQMRLGENGSFTDFARIQELPKNTAVTVLQKIGNGALDADYCFVSAELDGQTVYGYVPAGFVLKSGNAGVASGTQFRYARLDRGESATLLHKNTGEGITLSDREQLKVYDSLTDENGNVYAEYTNENGTYAGYIDPSILYEATPVVMVTLVIVMVAAAAVILSVCYLLLRKQPTLQ